MQDVDMTLDLDALRKQADGGTQKEPFQHQIDAFEALNGVFTFDDGKARSGLLVLPTGAGKTFTAVKWLCDTVLPQNMRILWLAHSFYLLDQACKEFKDYAGWIPEPRTSLNIRRVSSNPSHASASSIRSTDDILIMTTQTAVRNLHPGALDIRGKKVSTKFKGFLEKSRHTGLFVVLDEAHHAPAYGCRHLLIGEREPRRGILKMVPNAHLLGLTATPTYTDETRRGWLGKIFKDGNKGVIYQARRQELTINHILAKPNYIEMPTGKTLAVDDSLYDRLVREHKDLPEDIIEELASDAPRNDYIVKVYVDKEKQYGKTLIFADRKHQCIYLKKKLIKNGIKADAVYSHIDDPGSAEARNQRRSSENKRIFEQFKNGKGRDALDVLINVRMLTEGVDVPNVRTVFLTRQTTSAILMTQMIGRALRGRRAGGGRDKDEANVVLFMDKWRRLIDWATPSLEGGTDERTVTRGYYPLEYISIRLIEELCKHINTGGAYAGQPFARIFPVGWYQTRVSMTTAENNFDEMQTFNEFVMVYDHTKPKFDRFMKSVLREPPDEWSKEYLEHEWMAPRTEKWIAKWFDRESDDIGNTLSNDVIRIVRHIAQRGSPPAYHPFEERDQYDLDELAEQLVDKTGRQIDEALRHEYSKPERSLWKEFYKSYTRFRNAFEGAKHRVLDRSRFGERDEPSAESCPLPLVVRGRRELTPEEKASVKRRDGKACLCCSAKGRGVRLQIDHIKSYMLGGETSIDNSQTLCSICNRRAKGVNEINFKYQTTQLPSPKHLKLLPRFGTEDVTRSIKRLVNVFYHCGAVCRVNLHKRRNGAYYSTWKIELYEGNNPEWLLRHKEALVAHIRDAFGSAHVRNIKIVAPGKRLVSEKAKHAATDSKATSSRKAKTRASSEAKSKGTPKGKVKSKGKTSRAKKCKKWARVSDDEWEVY